MAKTVIVNLSPIIIVDFKSCFETIQEERKYLYDNITQKINKELGDIFIKRNLNLGLVENGEKITKQVTLDDIDFETTELVSNTDWMSKDFSGKLEPYEYLIGDSFWIKINKWCKLNHILNKKFNISLIDDAKKSLTKLTAEGKMTEIQLKSKQKALEKGKKELESNNYNECIESYVHVLICSIIIDKIKSSEQLLQDKEFAELNKDKDTTKHD